jgi:uncharacterized protein (DUF305 family)
MQTHHAQAVAMSAAMHRRSEDREVTTLAFDILTTQQGQIGIMDGWLDLSRSNRTRVERRTWMGEVHDGEMPGMATQAQLQRLDTLPLAQAMEQYLRLMIRHHRGALPMARHAAEHAGHPDVARLAKNMHDGQASEIELLQDMLVARGHPREPEQDPPVRAGQRDAAGSTPRGPDASAPAHGTGHGP